MTRAVGRIICDVFSCYHLNGGPLTRVQEYITPYDDEVISLAERFMCNPRLMYRYIQGFKYVKPVDDTWQYPRETIKKMAGDCMDFSALLVSMLIYCGYDAWVVISYLPDAGRDEPEFHAYVEVEVNGKKYKLETTCPRHKCGFGDMPRVRMINILKFNDSDIRQLK